MRKIILLAVPLVFFLLVSCSNAQQLYEKGNYQAAINKIDKMDNPTSQDLLLKAKSYITLGKQEESKSALILFLMLEENPSAIDRQFAVKHLLEVNNSDNLAIALFKETDGPDAQLALYRAYSHTSDTANAIKMIASLSSVLNYRQLMQMILDDPIDGEYIIRLFSSWYEEINQEDKQVFLELLNSFSNFRINESTAKQALALTDILSVDEFYTTDTITLSLLLKVKGNILDRLFDKVNARLYWTQAYKLNPDDEELRKKTQ